MTEERTNEIIKEVENNNLTDLDNSEEIKEDSQVMENNEDEKEKNVHDKKDLWKRIALYLVGFFSGMSVMAIELGASRLMAPYFSSSQIVWTIIIGTIMIAMAIGNIIGGKIADKSKKPTKLFILLFIAAIWVVLIPLFGKFIIAGIALGLAASNLAHNFLIWAALLSCLIIFVFPLLTLGMVTPNLVKFASRSLDENGKTVGRIEACNTVGSIIGTFIPTFVTIPTVGTSATFIIFGSILFVISIAYFFKIGFRRIFHSTLAVIILALGIASSFIPVAFWTSNTVYEGESLYNYLRVEENEDSFILSTNVIFGVQSIYYKEPRITNSYFDNVLAANVMVKEDPEFLILGLGTGTVAYNSKLYFNTHKIDGVEIDSKIVDLAYKYFDLPSDVNVFVNDGRAYMNFCKKKYDIILVDAYRDITIPFSMVSIEFFNLVNNCLNEDGIMIVNLNMNSSREGGINDYIYGTITSVFKNCYTVPAGSNVLVYASNGIDPKEQLYNGLDRAPNVKLKNLFTNTYNNMEALEKNGYLLTDDKAPVELLGMQVLDDMIIDELEGYRSKLRGKSIPEIIRLLKNGELF